MKRGKRMRMRGGFEGRLLCLLLVVAACDGEPSTPAPPPVVEARPAATPAVPPGGDVPLRYADARVWVRSSAADPRRVLWELSEQAGFLLDVTDLGDAPVALDFDGATLPDVVAAVAGPVPFALDYERDPATGRHVVVSVRVGSAPAVEVATPRPAYTPPPEEPRRKRRSPDEERLIRALGIANVDARRELVEDLDAEGVELDVLSHVMENDPDPELRALAADTLATAGTYGAVRNLVASLDSDDPAVLLVVIEALEFGGDESVVPDLVLLFEHDDPEVSEAAREAAEFLR